MKCINVNEIENEDNEKNMMESLADREYELCLKNALKEALDENEKVRIFFLNNNYLDERTNYQLAKRDRPFENRKQRKR